VPQQIVPTSHQKSLVAAGCATTLLKERGATRGAEDGVALISNSQAARDHTIVP
jgi:hypothetical protein